MSSGQIVLLGAVAGLTIFIGVVVAWTSPLRRIAATHDPAAV